MIRRALSAILELALSQRCETGIRRLYRGGSASYFVNISTRKPVLVLLSGRIGQNATTQQRQEYANRYEDYIVIVYSTLLGHLGGESFTVLGSQPNDEGVIVTSRIDGVVPIGVDWQLKPTDNGYKVTNLIVSGINMASMQRSDLVSVIQRNSGQMQGLLVALREKNASNGILRY
jgi:ABC-type transporter MlaC component